MQRQSYGISLFSSAIVLVLMSPSKGKDLLNFLWKSDKMLGQLHIWSIFIDSFNKFKNTGTLR